MQRINLLAQKMSNFDDNTHPVVDKKDFSRGYKMENNSGLSPHPIPVWRNRPIGWKGSFARLG